MPLYQLFLGEQKGGICEQFASCVHSCSSAGKSNTTSGATVEPVKVKQEPNTDDGYSCPSSVKTERSKDGRSACMVGKARRLSVLGGGNLCLSVGVTAPSVVMWHHLS